MGRGLSGFSSVSGNLCCFLYFHGHTGPSLSCRLKKTHFQVLDTICFYYMVLDRSCLLFPSPHVHESTASHSPVIFCLDVPTLGQPLILFDLLMRCTVGMRSRIYIGHLAMEYPFIEKPKTKKALATYIFYLKKT